MDQDAHESPIITAAAAGDAAAWAELVDTYRALVFSIPRSYSLPVDVCEDVFQTVFFLLFRNLSVLRDTGGIAKWLITTTERECWRVSKKRATDRARSGGELGNTRHAHQDDVSSSDIWERRQTVMRAMLKLEDRCRSLLTMLFRDPVRTNYDAIAASLNLPRGSIGPQRARCLKRLADILSEHEE